MKNNEIKYINLLGHKRNKNNQISNDEKKTNEEENTKENNQKILSFIRPEFYFNIIKRNNRINLEEKNENFIDNNINIQTEYEMNKRICQRCGSSHYVLSFNNFKSILEYSFKKKILIFKNFDLDETLNFDSPIMICLNCLLSILQNKTEFEKFFALKTQKKNDIKNNSFLDPTENPNLKNLNDIGTKEQKTKNIFNDKPRDISKKLYEQNTKISYSLINPQNNNDIYNNNKKNYNFFNILNHLALPPINFNIPFNRNFSNLNIPNYNNNDLNNYSKNQEFKDKNNNQTNLLHHQMLNYSALFQNTLLDKPPGLSTHNNTDTLNLYQLPLLNNNFSIKKNNKNENSQNIVMNNITTENNKEKASKNENENLEQNDLSESFTLIQNKDFDEIFQKTSRLFHKLLNIKFGQDSNLFSKALGKNSQILSSNNLNFINNSSNGNNNINKYLNQISNVNNFNENNSKHNIIESNNDLCNISNTVENHKSNDKVQRLN